MSAISTFQRPQHALVSAAVLEALKELEDKFGVNFNVSGGQVGGSSGLIKLGVKLRTAAGADSHDKTMWDAYCSLYGLAKEHFGQTFVSQGIAYKITGIAPSRPKFPVSAERVHDGRGFKFPASTPKMALAKKAAA